MKKHIKKIVNTFLVPFNKLYFQTFALKNRNTILNNNKLVNQLSGENILILAPHIDDETIGCGGAIIKYNNFGKKIHVCYLTKSQKRGSMSSAKGIADERKEEAYCLFDKLDIPRENLIFLQGEDGDLINSDIQDSLLETIENIRPDTIFIPIFLDTHQDHYAATVKLLESYKSKPNLFKKVQVYLYEAQSPITPLYSNIILDISDVFHHKLSLLNIFKSQNLNVDFIKNSNTINAIAPKIKKAEIFISMSMEEYVSVFTHSKYRSIKEYFSLQNNLKQNRDNLSLIPSYKSSIKYKEKLITNIKYDASGPFTINKIK